MNQTLDEFREEYLKEIRNDSRIEGMTPGEYFFATMLSMLQEMSEITDPQEISTCVDKTCRQNRKMSVDAYSYDESDKSIVLYINDYVDSLESATLTRTDITTLCNKMLYFLEEVYDGTLGQYFDDSNEILRIASELKRRLRRDYVDLNDDISIQKVKLYITTNKKLSERIKSFTDGVEPFFGKKVEVNVWSIQRIYDLRLSGKDKEPVVVDIRKFGFAGIPCLKAEMSNATDYDAYLAIIPGQLLHKIYYEYGSRLLEGNVRAFLSVKGKINKGIRKTIIEEPTKFFTYNNGIACTAQSVEIDENNNIVQIDDLQIINGGQTTASLTSAILEKKSELDNIFVPLKLTVVKNDDYDTVIANISKYANSQNKVTDADMFSNHPFHRKIEGIANKTLAPAKEGGINETLWYYERSRGKYEQEKFKLRTQAAKSNYTAKHPKDQKITKEELAKYYMSAGLLRPDLVAKGSQNCMKSFAQVIDKYFGENLDKINNAFFKRVVCYAIIFRETDRLVNKAPWYNVGGYKLNIVPYTISKLISMIPKDYCLDFNNIWKKQTLAPSTVKMINKIAYVTNEFIQRTANGVIVTEHCKKQDTWDKYNQLSGKTDYMTDEYNLELDQDFINDLLSKNVWDEQENSAKKDEKLTKSINILTEVYNLGADYWIRLLQEGTTRNLITEKEKSILDIVINGMAKGKIISDAQSKVIWSMRERLDNAGVLV